MNNNVRSETKKEHDSRLFTFLLGRKQPDVFTRLAFQIGLTFSVLMVFWSILSWFAYSYGWSLEASKGIPIKKLLEARAQHFGFTLNRYYLKLTQHFWISAISWIITCFSVLLLYRRNRFFIFFLFVGHSSYLFSTFFLLGLTFFMEEIGWFEKLALLVTHVGGWIIWILHRNERRGISNFKTD